MTTLLWGVSGDRPLHVVADELSRLGAQFVLLDQRDVLATAVDLRVGCQIRGSLRTPDWAVAFGEITAAYLRPDDPRAVPAVAAAGPDSAAWQHALRVNQALLSWAEITPAWIVNRPGASAANGSKPYQAELIRRHGFAVPETLITTDPVAVRAFWERHGSIIYKSVSAVRSVVAQMTAADLDRLPDVACCPTMFQAYVPGEDIRVHVVGDELFACQSLRPPTTTATPARIGSRFAPHAAGRRRRPLSRDDGGDGARGGGHRPSTPAGGRMDVLRGQPVARLHLLRPNHGPADWAGDRPTAGGLTAAVGGDSGGAVPRRRANAAAFRRMTAAPRSTYVDNPMGRANLLAPGGSALMDRSGDRRRLERAA